MTSKPFYLIAMVFAAGALACADPAVQPNMFFSQGGAGTWKADWEGVAGRTYFSQGGSDLSGWDFMPLIEFSDGPRGIGGQRVLPVYFVRLVHTDAPTTEPSLEDFAGDGIGSMIKLMMGENPFEPIPWEDTDSDGIHDAIERFWFADSLAGTGGGDDDANGNGIRDVFEIQAGEDPTTDQTGDPAARSNFQYDSMGRLITADIVTYAFDIEGNLEAATTPAPPEQQAPPPPEDPPEEEPPGEDPPPEDPPFPF